MSYDFGTRALQVVLSFCAMKFLFWITGASEEWEPGEDPKPLTFDRALKITVRWVLVVAAVIGVLAFGHMTKQK